MPGPALGNRQYRGQSHGGVQAPAPFRAAQTVTPGTACGRL